MIRLTMRRLRESRPSGASESSGVAGRHQRATSQRIEAPHDHLSEQVRHEPDHEQDRGEVEQRRRLEARRAPW